MTFATRVIRFLDEKKKKGVEDRPDLENDSPGVLASRLVSIYGGSKDQWRIGKPLASSLYSACMRMHVIGTVLGRDRVSSVSAGDRVTYSIGDALHYWAQNTPVFFGDRRVGYWWCLACRKVIFGRVPTGKCSCGAHHDVFRYQEHSLNLDGDYPVTGHPDLFLERRPRVFRLLELKSIDGDAFLTLKAPLVEHEWQVITYLWGCSQDKTLPVSIQSDYAYVLYFSKKKVVKEFPVKAFPVKQNPMILGAVTRKLAIYKKGMENYPASVPPVDEQCLTTNWGCWIAKSCAVKNDCQNLATVRMR